MPQAANNFNFMLRNPPFGTTRRTRVTGSSTIGRTRQEHLKVKGKFRVSTDRCLPRCALAQLLQPLIAEAARDDHHRAWQLARVMTGEMDDQRTRAPARRRAEHQGGDLVAPGQVIADRPHDLALLDDNIRLEAGFVQDLADRRADHPFDPETLLLFDRRLDPAELN